MSGNQESLKGEQIRITGTVQGVGFRPFVWRLAEKLKLRGQVWNDSEGVMIHAWGSNESLFAFRNQLKTQAPPLSSIESLHTSILFDHTVPHDFSIIKSQSGRVITNVSPDAATCPRCLEEINNPSNRRYRYAFTNCTHCGPRLSIIQAIPYDRVNTSMRCFGMCPECQEEYDNPGDRRFHAQPNACKTCGPRIWLENGEARLVKAHGFVDALAQATYLIQQGRIIAIKGIGGFHLACDARDAKAVTCLRQRKQRYHKPFALMARDLEVIRRYAHVSPEEQDLLQHTAAPIVILSMLNKYPLPNDIAPDQNRLGFMLPYTPLHSLLLQELEFPLVMTSGNRSDEVQCTDNKDARAQLSDIADVFVFHDRDIVNRLDDSVTRVINTKTQILRRSRGYAPHPLPLPRGFENSPVILAMGAELKNSFCMIKDGKAIVSQHQGDLEDASVFRDYRHNIALYQQLFDVRSAIIAVDRHPEYISSKLGQQMAATQETTVIEVQHHHAHIAACMAEHGLAVNTKPVLGIALDGLGYGDDGQLWGGEFLLADYCNYRRLAGIQPIAMPGGTRAIIEPWRNTFAHLQHALGWRQVTNQFPQLPFVGFMQDKPVDNLLTMIDKAINSPLASSAGRLFDAVAALLGVCRESVSYEGQAAMKLEVLAEQSFAVSRPYTFGLVNTNEDGILSIQWQPLWQELLRDVTSNLPREEIAARFHQTLLTAILTVIQTLAQQHPFETIALCGGVMQNQLLLSCLIKELSKQGYTVLYPQLLPANDGGISFGQAAVAAAQTIIGQERTTVHHYK